MTATDCKNITNELATLADYRTTCIFVLCSRIHGVTDSEGNKVYGLQINRYGQKVLHLHSSDAVKLRTVGTAKIKELRGI
jgi:hypothetical protein